MRANPKPNQEACELLSWDSDFFDRRIARVKTHRLDKATLQRIDAFCAAHQIECLYFLADIEHAQTVQLAESNGFSMVDVCVSYQCPTTQTRPGSPDQPPLLNLRLADSRDVEALTRIAWGSFTNSRFYFDPCFPDDLCDAMYETWVTRSLEWPNHAVLVAQRESEVIGFLSVQFDEGQSVGHFELAAMKPDARGLGVGTALFSAAIQIFQQKELKSTHTVTQLRNIGAQQLFQKLGLRLYRAQVWYHRWEEGCN